MAIKIQGSTIIDDSRNVINANQVGIATTSASTPLQVGSGSTVVVVDNLGEVGIGTTNPTSKLHVIGGANFTGVVTASSFSGNASSATYAPTAGLSTYAVTAGLSTYAPTAGLSTYAVTAGIATYTPVAGLSTYSITAGIATYAPVAGLSTYSVTAGIATYAFVAGLSTYTVTAGLATYAPTAGISTNLKGGSGGTIVYQSATDTTAFLANGSSGQILQSNGGTSAPSWVNAAPSNAIAGLTIRDEGTIVSGVNSVSQLNFVGGLVSVASTAGIATITLSEVNTNYALSAGIATYAFVAGLSTYTVTAGLATYAPTAGISTNLKGGSGGTIVYQSATDTTAFLANGSTGQILQSNGGTSAPSWVNAAPAGAITGLTIRDEGTIVGTANSVSQLNFVGNLISVASTAGIATITVGDYIRASGIATYALVAGLSTYAPTAGLSTYAVRAGIATYAPTAGLSTYAVTAGLATYAPTAGLSTYAVTAGIATYAPTAGVATALQNARDFSISGSFVTATAVSFNGTGNVALAATITADSIVLGTYTSGDYVKNLSGTANQITVTSGTGEGSTPTLSVPNQFTAPQDVTVTRDLQVNRNLNVVGNVTIGGTSATIFASTLNISDPDIVLGFRTDGSGNDISNDTTASHGGIAIASTEGNPLVQLFIAGIETNPATYKKIMWFKAGEFSGLGTDAWLSNYAVGIGSTQFPSGTRLAAGAVQFTERDLAVVRNINASGIVTASSFSGNASSATYATIAGIATYAPVAGLSTYAVTAGIATYAPTAGLSTYAVRAGIATLAGNAGFATVAGIATYAVTSGIATYAVTAGIATYAPTAGLSTYAVTAGIATYAPTAGTSTSVIGGIASVTQLQVTGISTFTNGPVFIGAATSTGTANQDLQVTGGAYVSGNLGIGTTNPLQNLHVLGNLLVAAGVSTAQHITQKAYEVNNGTLSWEGSAGQLFSITNNLTSGSIFSVNDVSGIPSVDVNADGTVVLAPYADGNVGIATTRPTSRLHVVGDGNFTGVVTASSFSGNASSATYAVTAGIATYTPVAGLSTYAVTAGLSTYAPTAGLSTYAVTAGIATYTPVAGLSTYSITAGIATYTPVAGLSTYAVRAGIATYAPVAGLSTYAVTAGIATYAPTAGLSTYAITSGVSTSVSGGTGSLTQLQVTGISTFTNGPVFIGAATSTGTPNQRLQVNGGASFVGTAYSVGIGTTNPVYVFTVTDTGTPATSGLTNCLADFTTTANSYGQINLRNTSSGTNASGDVIVTANNGSDTTNFIDLGINNSGFSVGSWTINGANDGYLYTSDGNLSIGAINASVAKYISFFTGGTLISNERMRINANGVGIGTTNPTSSLTVSGTVSITGISTIGNLRVTPVGTGVTVGSAGVVTYYGDGSQLSGVSGGLAISTNTTNQNQFLTYAVSTGSTTGLGVTATGLVFNPSTTRLGIGTTNPLFTTDVSGDVRVRSTNRMRFGGTSTTTNFYIQYNSTTNSLDFVSG